MTSFSAHLPQVYAIFQIAEIKESFSALGAQDAQAARIPYMVLTSIIPAMIGASEAGYLVLSWYIYREFGWDVYKGASDRMASARTYADHPLCLVQPSAPIGGSRRCSFTTKFSSASSSSPCSSSSV